MAWEINYRRDDVINLRYAEFISTIRKQQKFRTLLVRLRWIFEVCNTILVQTVSQGDERLIFNFNCW